MLFAWYSYKSANEKNHAQVKVRTTKAASDVELQDLVAKASSDDALETGEFRMRGYTSSNFGSIAKSSLGVSSVIWILLLLTLTLDYYGVFASISGKAAGFMV